MGTKMTTRHIPDSFHPLLQGVKERVKLRGAGMVVFDRFVKDVDEEEHYVVRDGSGICDLVDGSSITDASNVLGQVLFCCRPPSLLLGPSAETSELIQV